MGGCFMNVKNKAKFVLSVFLIVSSILIVSAILFVAILFFAPSQTKADKKLDTIQSEVQELPLAMRYSTLVGEDLELNLDKVLENNGYNSYTDECLCFYEDKVYFVFSYTTVYSVCLKSFCRAYTAVYYLHKVSLKFKFKFFVFA